MIGAVRDTWRARLMVVTVALLREIVAERPAAALPAMATSGPAARSTAAARGRGTDGTRRDRTGEAMKIETNDYLTVEDAMVALGCSKRGVYRSAARAAESGHDVFAELFGIRLIRRSAIAAMKQHYYPYYSEAHQAHVKEWGSKGGSAKAKNAAARQGGRKRAASSGTSGEPGEG